MEQVQKATEALIDAISKSEEYLRYQDARRNIIRYPILKTRADEFRKHNYDLQTSNADIFKEADGLREEYAYITQNAVIWEYLESENAFCRVLQRVNWQLLERLDFDAGLAEEG